ncbi:hypothetical protein [Legionella impletisoli]|uniref:Uncharacterized protein n=1 Tax=Legionella impletisoli TaxID=343510 RepID=A0A917JTK3_9GAMM|nr:hypothetical protein [Legionella impletisoli]GGI85182.1 hypothetical protein GCM10007966_12210 [Legionella impletisoli]
MKLKRYQITYDKVPESFDLPEGIYLSPEIDALPEDSSQYTEEQKSQLRNYLTTMLKDLPRTCYIDFDGRTVEDLKSFWVVSTPFGHQLAPGVYPGYTQGNLTGASIGHVIYTVNISVPLMNSQPHLTKKLSQNEVSVCFFYIDDEGNPAGFSLIAMLDDLTPDKKEKGWIITTLQNITAAPKDRAVEVFATENFVPNEGQSEIIVDGFASFSGELRQAIRSDKVFRLISTLFNKNGSINEESLRVLHLCIQPNTIFDPQRLYEYKKTELQLFITLAEQAEVPQEVVKQIKYELEHADLLNEDVYKDYMNRLLAILTDDLKSFPFQVREAVKAFHKKTAQNVADVKISAMKQGFMLESIDSYQQLMTDIPEQVRSLSQALQAVEQPTVHTRSFLSRNLSPFGKGLLIGLLAGVGVALALTGVLAPLGIAIAAAATTLLVGGFSAGIMIKQNEQHFAAEERRYKEIITSIEEESLMAHTTSLSQCIGAITQSQQQEDDVDIPNSESISDFSAPSVEELSSSESSTTLELESFSNSGHEEEDTSLEPTPTSGASEETIVKPSFLKGIQSKKLSPESVAHALWLKDKRSESTSESLREFSMWANKKGLSFGEQEVQEVISKTYQMKHKST